MLKTQKKIGPYRILAVGTSIKGWQLVGEKEGRRGGLHEIEMNCSRAGVFELQVVHHPGRIWYDGSGKAVWKATLQQSDPYSCAPS